MVLIPICPVKGLPTLLSQPRENRHIPSSLPSLGPGVGVGGRREGWGT